MPAISPTAQALSETQFLFAAGNYKGATALYEEVLRSHPNDVLASLRDRVNFQLHKNILKCRLVFQMLAQDTFEHGFYVNFGPYLFAERPLPDVCISASAVAAVNRYKGTCSSIEELKQGVLERVATHPLATSLLYYAHSVASDVVDLFIIGRKFPMKRLVDIGCGAGMQAATLAKLKPEVETIYLFEEQDFMQDGAGEAFIANGLTNFHINKAMEAPIDGFYSFRACAFIFSVDLYIEQIRKARCDRSWALMDLSDAMNVAQQRDRLLDVFAEATVFYDQGKNAYRHDRTFFDGVK